MRLVPLFILLAASAVAQVPAHSVTGSVTLDIADISLPVPYGAAETRATISACTTNVVTTLAFTVDYDGETVPFYVQAWSITKTDSGYCTSVVAPVESKRIGSVVVDQTSTVQITNSAATPPPGAANRAKKRD